ncbi:hypothetical protein ROZALSC1DRAFT_31489, partial [Rozella allomycis CSF55]
MLRLCAFIFFFALASSRILSPNNSDFSYVFDSDTSELIGKTREETGAYMLQVAKNQTEHNDDTMEKIFEEKMPRASWSSVRKECQARLDSFVLYYYEKYTKNLISAPEALFHMKNPAFDILLKNKCSREKFSERVAKFEESRMFFNYKMVNNFFNRCHLKRVADIKVEDFEHLNSLLTQVMGRVGLEFYFIENEDVKAKMLAEIKGKLTEFISAHMNMDKGLPLMNEHIALGRRELMAKVIIIHTVNTIVTEQNDDSKNYHIENLKKFDLIFDQNFLPTSYDDIKKYSLDVIHFPSPDQIDFVLFYFRITLNKIINNQELIETATKLFSKAVQNANQMSDFDSRKGLKFEALKKKFAELFVNEENSDSIANQATFYAFLLLNIGSNGYKDTFAISKIIISRKEITANYLKYLNDLTDYENQKEFTIGKVSINNKVIRDSGLIKSFLSSVKSTKSMVAKKSMGIKNTVTSIVSTVKGPLKRIKFFKKNIFLKLAFIAFQVFLYFYPWKVFSAVIGTTGFGYSYAVEYLKRVGNGALNEVPALFGFLKNTALKRVLQFAPLYLILVTTFKYFGIYIPLPSDELKGFGGIRYVFNPLSRKDKFWNGFKKIMHDITKRPLQFGIDSFKIYMFMPLAFTFLYHVTSWLPFLNLTSIISFVIVILSHLKDFLVEIFNLHPYYAATIYTLFSVYLYHFLKGPEDVVDGTSYVAETISGWVKNVYCATK